MESLKQSFGKAVSDASYAISHPIEAYKQNQAEKQQEREKMAAAICDSVGMQYSSKQQQNQSGPTMG